MDASIVFLLLVFIENAMVGWKGGSAHEDGSASAGLISAHGFSDDINVDHVLRIVIACA